MFKRDIPFYEECSFGYYEWFVEKNNNEIVIHKIATLAPFKRIISDRSYNLDIKYLPELINKEKFLNRNEAYRLVKKYWKNNHCTNYMKIKIDDYIDHKLEDTHTIKKSGESSESEQLGFL